MMAIEGKEEGEAGSAMGKVSPGQVAWQAPFELYSACLGSQQRL
jgi:hypothetical protein